MRRIVAAIIALLTLNGCAATGPVVRGYPVPRTEVEVNEFGARVRTSWDVGSFLATRSGPELLYQNQAGGWERVGVSSWIDLPVNQGGITFQIVPNGHFVGYDAQLDGTPVGGGNNLWFGIGPWARDNGKHLLVVNVRRKFSPLLGDPVPDEVTESHTFRVIIFFKASY